MISYSTDLHLNNSKKKKSLNSKDEMQLPHTHVKGNRQYDDLKCNALLCVCVSVLHGCFWLLIPSKIQQDRHLLFLYLWICPVGGIQDHFVLLNCHCCATAIQHTILLLLMQI